MSWFAYATITIASNDHVAHHIMNRVSALQVATYLFLKTVATPPPNYENRCLVYGTKTPLEITIAGAMSNALQECEHHLGNAAENRQLLDTSQR